MRGLWGGSRGPDHGAAPHETCLVPRRRWCIPLPFSKRDPSRLGAEQVKGVVLVPFVLKSLLS